MLWLAQGSGDLNTGAVLHPGPSLGFVRGIRSLLPFAAANLALAIIIFKLARHRSQGTLFFGPLGLSVLYGGVGVFASFLSPNGLAALYWAAAYLSVPVVLWAIAWGPAALVRLQRLVNITWMFIVLLTYLVPGLERFRAWAPGDPVPFTTLVGLNEGEQVHGQPGIAAPIPETMPFTRCFILG